MNGLLFPSHIHRMIPRLVSSSHPMIANVMMEIDFGISN